VLSEYEVIPRRKCTYEW